MDVSDFLNILKAVAGRDRVGMLAEGTVQWTDWLHEEIWAEMAKAGADVARDQPYSDETETCALVCTLSNTPFWIELLAFGQLDEPESAGALDAFDADIARLKTAPFGAGRLAVLVLPKSLGGHFFEAVADRFPGANRFALQSVVVIYERF